MWTPFGRYYSQLWTNQLIDAPFIRTEAILWRETGLLLRWDPGIWVIDAGLFNGHHGRDANSTKGLVARIGAEEENWALGSSVKVQDGFGSENQKTYNNHVGLDAMVRQGRWRLFSEVLWDEYGLRRDDFDPLDIFWEKSIYFRDINKADGVPIQGTGYYVAAGLHRASLDTLAFFRSILPRRYRKCEARSHSESRSCETRSFVR